METAQVFSVIILFLPFSLVFKIHFVLLEYPFLNLPFISCSLLCHTPISPGIYVHLLLSLIFWPLDNSIPSADLTFPLFLIITPHFLIPNSMSMSLLKTSAVDTKPFIHFHSFHGFKLSIHRRWLTFSHPPRVYLAMALGSTWISGIMHITNNKGDKLLPRKVINYYILCWC